MRKLFLEWLKLEWRDISWEYRNIINWECEHFCLFYGMLNFDKLKEHKIIYAKQGGIWGHYYIFDGEKYIDYTLWQFGKEYPEEHEWENPPLWFREIWRYSLKDYVESQRAFMFYKDPRNIIIDTN